MLLISRLHNKSIGNLLVALTRGYQLWVSPQMTPRCRYYPTCSQYLIDVIRLRGPWRGVVQGLWRIARCHPLLPGGHDPAQ